MFYRWHRNDRELSEKTRQNEKAWGQKGGGESEVGVES